jgi:NAD(P)-dependent dehydrogenase (short-subunit alcohol dehydrogenase family)
MLAQAMAPRVRVVGIAPGLTLPSYLQDAETFRQAHAKFSPLGRSSTPEDVAAAVVFAMNNQSLTGTIIQVDGGQHLQRMPRDVSLMPAVS